MGIADPVEFAFCFIGVRPILRSMDATMGSIAPTGLKGKLAALEESFGRFDSRVAGHGPGGGECVEGLGPPYASIS